MPAAPRTALVGAGPVSVSWVAKLPGLRENLEYVKSGSLRVASRIANSIRAGAAVETYEEMRKAELILIAVPDQELLAVLTELKASPMRWESISLVLCGRQFDTRELLPFREIGATVGSLDLMDGFEAKRFLFEGDRGTLLRLRRLVEEEGTAKIVEMAERRRAVYEAGLTFAGGMSFQMIAAAVEAMRSAGLKDKHAEIAVEAAVVRALRGYISGGRRGWTGALAEGNREELKRQYEGLLETKPELAEMFLKLAIDYMVERGPELGKPDRRPSEG